MTFCRGDPHKAYAALLPRLRAVIDVNPWIAGRFVAQHLVHPLTGSSELVADILSLQKCAAVTRRQPYSVLNKAVARTSKLSVQTGRLTQWSGRRISKLVVVEPEVAGGEMALIFSMSHSAVDASNYYRIYNMIAGTAPVQAISAVRIPEYDAREREWIGPANFKWLLYSPGLLKGLWSALLFGRRSTCHGYYVDNTKVRAIKSTAAAVGGVPFVSTNDILTSHFCKTAECRVTMMVC